MGLPEGCLFFQQVRTLWPFPDAAYSMRGDALGLCYAAWERAEDDAANAA